MNDQINSPKIRLIGEDGNQVGIVELNDALFQAQQADLDLVEISPNANPPVCQIMDYGKYQFQKSKQKSSARKKQRQVNVKEVKFRPTIEEGDFQVKLRNLIRFLTQGDKVKVTLRFRGRELSHQEIGMEIMHRLQNELQLHGIIEQTAKMEGRQLVMVIAPKVQAKAN